MFRRRGLSFRRRRRRNGSLIKSRKAAWICQIAAVVALAFVCVMCFGMKVTVIGNSMESTLPEGGQVLVSRIGARVLRPAEGDVIVFRPNGNEDSHYYIKRVVGVPGDEVQIRDGMLYVNGELSSEQGTTVIRNAGMAAETVTVGEDEYFVLGDNRNSSEDSRYANIGNVKRDDIDGKVWFVSRPFGRMGFVK